MSARDTRHNIYINVYIYSTQTDIFQVFISLNVDDSVSKFRKC